MKGKHIFLLPILIAGFSFASAQTITPTEYISIYKDIAVAEMARSGIPASVTLAQGILETESGNSELVKKSNNHFGIKCKSTWRGETVSHTDDAPDECFRKYPKAEDSYRDHSDYLKSAPRYASLFQLEAGDYKGWAYGLKKAGYATNPKYPQILISNIERYNLQQYDLMTTPSDAMVIVQTPPEKPVEVIPVVKETPIPTFTVKQNTKFNSLKAFYAVKGTSLLAVAVNADIPLAKLLEFNDLQTDGLLKNDAWIYLEKKAKQGNRDTYTALQDESLYDAAQNSGVQLQGLAVLNNLEETARIKKGTRLKLRNASSLSTLN